MSNYSDLETEYQKYREHMEKIAKRDKKTPWLFSQNVQVIVFAFMATLAILAWLVGLSTIGYIVFVGYIILLVVTRFLEGVIIEQLEHVIELWEQNPNKNYGSKD